VSICHGHVGLAQAEVRFTDGQLGDVRRMLLAAADADGEREALALAVGRLYAWAGEQSEIRNDRGGNYADGSMPGKMDCIDHSTSTTRLLDLLETRGYLRFHRGLPPASRHFAWLFVIHWSAVVEEITDGEAPSFVVDSWFVDNGEPAVILPLADWKKGAGPDV